MSDLINPHGLDLGRTLQRRLAEAEAEIARLREALTQIRDREHPYPQFSWAMGIASLALISGRPHDAATGCGE